MRQVHMILRFERVDGHRRAGLLETTSFIDHTPLSLLMPLLSTLIVAILRLDRRYCHRLSLFMMARTSATCLSSPAAVSCRYFRSIRTFRSCTRSRTWFRKGP